MACFEIAAPEIQLEAQSVARRILELGGQSDALTHLDSLPRFKDFAVLVRNTVVRRVFSILDGVEHPMLAVIVVLSAADLAIVVHLTASTYCSTH